MKILIIRTSSLGDIIQAYPTIAYLRSKFPDAEIDWVVESRCATLVESHPEVRRTLKIRFKPWRARIWSYSVWQEIRAFRRQLRSTKYDLIIDLQGNFKSALFTWQARGETKIGFGIRTVREKVSVFATTHRYDPPIGREVRQDYLGLVQMHFGDSLEPVEGTAALRVTDADKSQVAELLSMKRAPWAMLCPGSARPSKMLSRDALLRFCKLAQEAFSFHFLLAWGSDSERELAHWLHSQLPHHTHVMPTFSLPALQNVMAQMDLVVAMDSMALHLCGTTATPSFSVFGPTSSFKFKPSEERHLAVQGSCPYGVKYHKSCPKIRECHAPCMTSFAGDELFRTFQTWWSYSIQPPPKTRSPS